MRIPCWLKGGCVMLNIYMHYPELRSNPRSKEIMKCSACGRLAPNNERAELFLRLFLSQERILKRLQGEA